MNRALLAELQHHQTYPSVTLLLNTTAGAWLATDDRETALRLVDNAHARLTGDVSNDVRDAVIGKLTQLIADCAHQPATNALALCASPGYTAAVTLGRRVDERVVVDDTFATRDLVADVNRTAIYRVVTISDRRVRLFVGDRRRLVEERTDTWPQERTAEDTATTWARRAVAHVSAEEVARPLPTIVAGVARSVRRISGANTIETIGAIAGNHDRSSAVDLHHAAWPLVTDWLRKDRDRALARLDDARSARRYASGIDEIWSLAHDGRIELVVVEEGYRLAARTGDNHHLYPASDPEAPDVIDDVVDDLIEHVLRQGGHAVLVPDGDLTLHGRIAATTRY